NGVVEVTSSSSIRFSTATTTYALSTAIKGWGLMASTVHQGTPELVIVQLSASWFATARHAPTSSRTGPQDISKYKQKGKWLL
ncbi:hypothetical protein BpHYR1_004165, partial [Brachionus plicatilis]